MTDISNPPLPESPSSREGIRSLHGYTVLDAFGLRIGSVYGIEPTAGGQVDHLCVETNVPGLGRRRHLLPIAYVTNVNQNSRFLQLSRLKHESFASLFPDVTGSSAFLPDSDQPEM